MKRKTLKEMAARYADKQCPYDARVGGNWEISFFAFLAGAVAGKREGKAEAMAECGWGDGRKRKNA